MKHVNPEHLVPASVPATFDACRVYTRLHAKSFYFSSFLLPKRKRLAAYAVYAFCRYVDDVIDRAGHEMGDRLSAVAELRRLLEKLYDESASAHGAFSETVHRYSIPAAYFLDVIDGVTSDLDKDRYESFSELYDYCYKVAGAVGLIMCRIFGYSDPVAQCYAEDLGTAMQLTNILRDIREDAAMGRIYIPREEMEHFAYSETMLLSGEYNDAFRAMMRFQIERARMYYRRAANGISLLTNDGSRSTVGLMARLYSGILDEIERNNYDVFSRRHHVSLAKKFWLVITRADRTLAARPSLHPDASVPSVVVPGTVK